MIHIKDHRQKDLFDPWSFLSPKRRELLDQSWAGLFQKELLCELPVGEVASFFSDDFGRPTKELHTVLGVLILQQAHDLTDDETVNQLALIRQNIFVHNLAGRRDGGAPAQTVRSTPAWKRCVLIDHVQLRAGVLRNSPSTAVPMRPAKHLHPKE